jgi:predicted ATPase/class 3 adenylate cyclase
VAELPTGTVTFLFTDIEGSTRLLQEIGDRFQAVQDEQAGIVRRAIDDAGGVVVRIDGDAFFAAFPSPVKAVEAAVTAQRGLAAHHWSHGAPLRVRMGLHTGDGVLGGGDYVGIDVNRAARIADAAHGGQVLVSGATRGLVEDALPEGVSLRDLGAYRLKDIAHPQHLHDVLIEGLPSDHPPLRSVGGRPNNLPAQLTSFVGRTGEIAEVRTLLAGTRLLTLTGAGGAGKTRLALQVAAEVLTEYGDGVFLVDLSSVTDPALVPSAVARALGVSEVAGRPILEAVKDYLRDKEALLVVDNFERVAEAAPAIEELLSATPGVKVLATSRMVLSLRGEQEYVVPPLEPPDPERVPDLPTLGRYDAVRLFTERAAAVDPRFRLTEDNAPAVAEITARLDGLPLAIELAATRAKVLTPEQMLPRLRSGLSLLISGGRTLPERHRTLSAAISWSHDLLDPAERRLFARLSVFAGGWTLESAEAVCRPSESGMDALEGLTALVDMSLVRRTETPEAQSRFSMLETIREFGQEQLQPGGELDAVRRRHAEHFLDLAVEAESHLIAEDQGEWLDRCDLEHPNIRAALRWAIESGEADRAQQSAGALWRFWHQRGHLSEGRRWLEEVLAIPSGLGRTAARAKALTGAGGIAWWEIDGEAARSFYDEALAIERDLGDPGRIAEALYNEAFAVLAGGDAEGAARLLDESLDLFGRVDDELGVARVLALLVIRDARAGDWDAVSVKLQEATAISRRLGGPYDLANALVWLAIAYGRLGRPGDARAAALEALALFRKVHNPTGIALALRCLGVLAAWEGRHEDAMRLAGASKSLDERLGRPTGDIRGLDVMEGFANPLDPSPGLVEGDLLPEARANLSEDVAERAWEEGLAMTEEEAQALASADPRD